ncbi:hypothetical protein B0H21DRAFT_182386 [Amylocystis lapponica]|nr:hypothetical protein B0H21DRAFT_182386 [Amylocystis lapponica]
MKELGKGDTCRVRYLSNYWLAFTTSVTGHTVYIVVSTTHWSVFVFHGCYNIASFACSPECVVRIPVQMRRFHGLRLVDPEVIVSVLIATLTTDRLYT